MSFVNDLFGKFWDMKSAINNKKGVVSISKNGPSPDEILAGINSIPTQPVFTSSSNKQIIVAELPNTTIELRSSGGTLLDTETTHSINGGLVTFAVTSIGTYTVIAKDSSDVELWTNTITIDNDGVYNCKTGKAFADYTPAEVNTAAKNGYAQYMWSVGDSRTISTLGSNRLWVIAGFNHDNRADGLGKANLSMVMQSATAATYRHNTVNANNVGWEGSLIRQNGLKSGDSYYLVDATVTSETTGTFYIYDDTSDTWVEKTLPSEYESTSVYYTKTTLSADGAFIAGLADWDSYMLPVIKETANAGATTAFKYFIKSKDRVWIPSDAEVFGSENRYNNYSRYQSEGQQYDYFKENKENRFALGSSAWLRSPYSGYSYNFCIITNTGYITTNTATTTNATRLGFCL